MSCSRSPPPSTDAVARFILDRAGQRLLDKVNRAVNREFRALAPFADPNRDGQWDCENYAAEKRARLAAAGAPVEALQMVRVFTSRGVSHAVLVVACDRRGEALELVLDNLSQWATPRQALPYTGWEPMTVQAGQSVTPGPQA